MFKLYWDYKGSTNTMTFEDRNTANEIWTVLKSCPAAQNIRTEKPESAEPKHFYCEVEFTAGGRRYTYLTNQKVSIGTWVVVVTDSGRELVKVVGSGEKTNTELAKLCPLSRFKHIEGVVHKT